MSPVRYPPHSVSDARVRSSLPRKPRKRLGPLMTTLPATPGPPAHRGRRGCGCPCRRTAPRPSRGSSPRARRARGQLAGHLGKAVVAQRREGEPLAHLDPPLAAHAGRDEDAQARDVVIVDGLAVEEVGAVGRHQQGVRAAVALDQPHRLVHVPAREQHARRARQDAGQVAEDEAADEAELGQHEQAVLAGQTPAREHLLARVAHGVGGVHDALGGRGRARQQKDHGHGVGVDGLACRVGGLGEQRGQVVRFDGDDERHGVRNGAGTGDGLRSPEADQGAGAGLAHQRADLLLAEERRHEGQDGTAVHARQQRDDGLDRVCRPQRPTTSPLPMPWAARRAESAAAAWRSSPKDSVASPQMSAGLSGTARATTSKSCQRSSRRQ